MNDFDALIRQARKAGWTVEPTKARKTGALAWTPPGGGTLVFTKTRAQNRTHGIANVRAALRRAGLDV